MPPGADEIWERLRAGVNMPTLRTVHWAQQAPQSVLDSVLSEELSVGAGADGNFETSYGGQRNGPFVNFRYGAGGAGEACETWQILTPVRSHLGID